MSAFAIQEKKWCANSYLFSWLQAPTIISESLPISQLPLGHFETRHVVGIVLFLVASYWHHQSHVILADLRKKSKVLTPTLINEEMTIILL